MQVPVEARSLLVETTQTVIAVSVIFSAIYGELIGLQSNALNNAAFFILGFYFGRPTKRINDRKLEIDHVNSKHAVGN